MEFAIAALLGYLLGSIPFGLILCKVAGYGDIRKIGSGNIGATNVLRTGNKPLAFATLILDIGKGAIAVFVMRLILESLFPACEGYDWDNNSFPYCHPIHTFPYILIAGLFALIGHCYPIWLKFKGGKGVATTLGTFIAIQPLLGLVICGIWLLSALLFRISSLAALIAVGLSPMISHLLFGSEYLSGFCAAVAALVYIKHRENIKRLFAGEEPKIGKKKKSVNE